MEAYLDGLESDEKRICRGDEHVQSRSLYGSAAVDMEHHVEEPVVSLFSHRSNK